MSSQPESAHVKPIRLVIFCVIALISSVIWFSAHLGTWDSENTLIAFYTLVAFLAMTAASFTLVQARVRVDTQQTLLHAPLIFIATLNFISAATLLLEDYTIQALEVVSVSAIAVVSVMILISAILFQRSIAEKRSILVMIMIGAGFGVLSLIIFILIPILPVNAYLAITIGLGVFSELALILAGIFWSKPVKPFRNYDVNYVVAGFAIYSISWIPNSVSLLGYDSVRALGITLQVCGLILVLLGSALPYLQRIGLDRRSSYAIPLGLASVAIFPGFIIIFSLLFPEDFRIRNAELYILIHFGAAILALIMAILLFRFNVNKKKPNIVPIIAIFLTWSAVELFLSLTALFFGIDFYVSKEIPLIVGSFTTLILIVFAVRYTRNPPTITTFSEILKRMLLGIAPFVLGMTIVTVVVEEIIDAWLGYPELPLGEILLLMAIQMVTYAYVYLAAILLNESKGKTSVEVLAIAFLSLWIVPLMTKSNFHSWTIGWWSSEILLFCGLLIGPAIIGLLYLSQMEKSEDSQKLATLYADILAHDISNYHQSIIISLGLLQMNALGESARDQVIDDANMQLQRADLLIKNVRRLGVARELRKGMFNPTDIVETILGAYYVASRVQNAQDFEFNINKDTGTCFTLANDLLVDVFINLIDNAIKYASEKRAIDVEIEEIKQNKSEMWKIRTIDYGKGIEPNRILKLFTRFMEGASGTGLGLSVIRTLVEIFDGSVEVSARVPEDFSKGTVFTVYLPKV
ncbi:MAG: ATP-binding protein [Candidatus Thorarchaeota archaeon]